MSESTSYPDDAEMRNGGNGNQSQTIIPVEGHVSDPTEFVTQATRVDVPEDAVATPGTRIFIQAPQYHWHSSGAEGIDGEARERLVALEALVYRFGQQTETREAELTNRLETESAVRAIGASDNEEFRIN